jgi:hypothetical protein
MPKFDYAGYFNRIREIERLVIPADKISWLERYSKPDKPVDVLLLARIIALTSPAKLGLSGAPFHEPFHARGPLTANPGCYA